MLLGNLFHYEPIHEVLVADSIKDRLIGYMFKSEPHYNAILFKSSKSFHTFFMKFEVDVLFLDENMEIIKKVEGLQPHKMILPIKGAKSVLAGKRDIFSDYNLGDKLEIEENIQHM